MSNTPDIRVTSCAGCGMTVTLVGSGTTLGDFDWLCPYEGSDCPYRRIPQRVRQLRGPLKAVAAGMPNRPLADSPE